MNPRTLLRGTTFLLTDGAGDVLGERINGLFVDDTRHLVRWVLTVDGMRPVPLSAVDGPASTELTLAPPARRGENPPYLVLRDQALGAGTLTEVVRLVSYRDTDLSVRVSYKLAADFADQFELRTDRVFDKSGAERSATAGAAGVVLGYVRGDFARHTAITAGPAPRFGPGGLDWTVTLPAGGEVSLAVTVRCRAGNRSAESSAGGTDARTPGDPLDQVRRLGTAARDAVRQFVVDTPAPVSGSGPRADALRRCVDRGLRDLAVLRIPAPEVPGQTVIAAGVPWFLTMFGRDSLLTSLFLLPYRSDTAAGTLRALAAVQGRAVDPDRAEEPGKILHELRVGELSRLGQVPYARYYGTVDATPLFLVLLDEYHEHTGDTAMVVELEPAARNAVRWMYDHGGLADGEYLAYRTDGTGLVNHCWKDSADSIRYRSGRRAEGAVAVCEAQGYAYRALLGVARLARQVWGDESYADQLTARAARLRAAFATGFRLPDGFVALAVDDRGRQVDALASNAGHALWSGILDADWGRTVGARLVADDFFSGWGLRTLASGQPAYHPVSYHLGGVWPHDTAIAVAGLARYGLRDAAVRIAEGLVDAAAYHDYRLPEVLTGLPRTAGPPVPYPHSCSPQAWAAAAPLQLLTALSC